MPITGRLYTAKHTDLIQLAQLERARVTAELHGDSPYPGAYDQEQELLKQAYKLESAMELQSHSIAPRPDQIAKVAYGHMVGLTLSGERTIMHIVDSLDNQLISEYLRKEAGLREAYAGHLMISIGSPIAMAILGKALGETFQLSHSDMGGTIGPNPGDIAVSSLFDL